MHCPTFSWLPNHVWCIQDSQASREHTLHFNALHIWFGIWNYNQQAPVVQEQYLQWLHGPFHHLHRRSYVYKDLLCKISFVFSPVKTKQMFFFYLFHVSVVHEVIWHFVRLQFNNLLQLIIIAFPLAHNDHFVKEEDIPGNVETYLSVNGIK